MATPPLVIMALIAKFKAEAIESLRKKKEDEDNIIVIIAKHKHYDVHPDFPDCIPRDEQRRKNKKRRHKEMKNSKRNEKRMKNNDHQDVISGRNEVSPMLTATPSIMDTPAKIEVEENAVPRNIITREKESCGRDSNMHPVSPVISVLGNGWDVKTGRKAVASPVISVLSNGWDIETRENAVSSNTHMTLNNNAPICSVVRGKDNKNVNHSASDVVYYTATITKRPNPEKVTSCVFPLTRPTIAALPRSMITAALLSTTVLHPTTDACPSTTILQEVTKIVPQRSPIASAGHRSPTPPPVPTSWSKTTDTVPARPNNHTSLVQPMTSADGLHSTRPRVSHFGTGRQVVKADRSYDPASRSSAAVTHLERYPLTSLLTPANSLLGRSAVTSSTSTWPEPYNSMSFNPVSLPTPYSFSWSRAESTVRLFQDGGKVFEEDTNSMLGSVRHRPAKHPGILTSQLNNSLQHSSQNKEDHIAADHLFSMGSAVAPPVNNLNVHSAADETENEVTDRSAEKQSKLKKSKPSLPKHAISTMKSWLCVHRHLPYPTVEDKDQIVGWTKLTLRQVDNWFTNARRRDLKMILEEEKKNQDHFLKTILPQHTHNINVLNTGSPEPPEHSLLPT